MALGCSPGRATEELHWAGGAGAVAFAVGGPRVKQVRKVPRQTGILLRGEVGCSSFSQPRWRTRAESGHRSPVGSGRAHSAQFGPASAGDSSPPAPRTDHRGCGAAHLGWVPRPSQYS